MSIPYDMSSQADHLKVNKLKKKSVILSDHQLQNHAPDLKQSAPFHDLVFFYLNQNWPWTPHFQQPFASHHPLPERFFPHPLPISMQSIFFQETQWKLVCVCVSVPACVRACIIAKTHPAGHPSFCHGLLLEKRIRMFFLQRSTLAFHKCISYLGAFDTLFIYIDKQDLFYCKKTTPCRKDIE